jgi:glycine betaine catabolism B
MLPISPAESRPGAAMPAADPLAHALIDGAAVWNAEEDDVLVCRHVRAETHDVKTFVFSARSPRLFRFKPGQFLTFTLALDGGTVNRCYTIASPPTRPHLAAITVKRVPGGAVSNWLHDTLRPGIELRALGPLGDFSTLVHRAPKYLFLSGGSGITPLMSIARSHFDLAADCDIVFVHNARSPADIIFRGELELMARQSPGFRLALICEADSPDERWHGYRGRLSLPMLRLLAPDLLEREIFTCGPAPYMQAVRAMVNEAGCDMARYHEESFDFVAAAPPVERPAETTTPVTATYRVEFAKSRRVIACAPTTNVLHAALAAGIRLPSSCTRGLCGTCKSTLLSGAVDMKHEGGIRQREIDNGQILICCSKPLGDLVIDR